MNQAIIWLWENVKLLTDGFKTLNWLKNKKSILENNEHKGVDVPEVIGSYILPRGNVIIYKLYQGFDVEFCNHVSKTQTGVLVG